MTNDDTNLGEFLEQEREIAESCLQQDVGLETVNGTSTTVCGTFTSVPECQNCAQSKKKLGRLQETYRKLKYRHRNLREEARRLQQLCKSEVIYCRFKILLIG